LRKIIEGNRLVQKNKNFPEKAKNPLDLELTPKIRLVAPFNIVEVVVQ